MGRLLRTLIKVGLLLGVVAVVLRLVREYQGSPEGVGDEGFSFDVDDSDPFAIDESTLGGDVSPELLERLVCPLDKGPLELVDGKWLVNPRNGYRYPITDGIPVMLIEVGERYRDPSLITQSTSGAIEGNGSSASADGQGEGKADAAGTSGAQAESDTEDDA
jgi:uncharacterized protein YbaR (Trm112 family)